MHSCVLRDHLSYRIEDVDAGLGLEKPADPVALAWVRAVFTHASKQPEFSGVLTPSSSLCFASRLLPKGSEEDKKRMVDGLMDSEATLQPTAMFLRRRVKLVSCDVADRADAKERGFLVAIENTNYLADPDAVSNGDEQGPPTAVLLFGTDGPRIRIVLFEDKSATVEFYEKKTQKAVATVAIPNLPPLLCRKMTSARIVASKDFAFKALYRTPTSSNQLPDPITSRLAKICQNHLHLNVLVSAAAPVISRTETLDNVVIEGAARALAFDPGYRVVERCLKIHLPLSQSSCSCFCPAHGGVFCKNARSTITFSICGSHIKDGGVCPQCKKCDSQRLGFCIRFFDVSLRCDHLVANKFTTARRLSLTHGLSTAAKIELQFVLATAAKFFAGKQRTAMGALDMQLLQIRNAESDSANDTQAVVCLEARQLYQKSPGELTVLGKRSLSASEKRVKRTHFHLFPSEPLVETLSSLAQSHSSQQGAVEPTADSVPETELPPEEVGGVDEDDDDEEDDENTLDEFIDIEGLEQLKAQILQLVKTADTDKKRLKAQANLFYARQLEEACKNDIVEDGPLGFMCYRMKVKYAQKRNFGRLNTVNTKTFQDFFKNEKRVLCLQGAPRQLRPFLCGRFCRDYDLVNAQPWIWLILAGLLRGGDAKMPTLKYWVEDRDGFIAHIAEVHNIVEDVKDMCKNLIISMIFGGEYEHWVERHGFYPEPLSPLVKRLGREFAELRAFVFEHEKYRAHVQRERLRHKKKGEKTEAEADRSIFAIIAQNEENTILNAIREGVAEQQFGVESLQFDGLFVVERDDAMKLDLKAIEEKILEKTGYTMKLLEKPLFFKGSTWPQIEL